MLTDPKLAQSMDCVDLRDFTQYYRGRYFGLHEKERGKVTSCCLHPDLGPRPTAIPIFVFDKANARVLETAIGWDELVANGRFGSPILGTTTAGPTYAFLSCYPVRESTKGVGLQYVEYHVPQQSFFMRRYGHGHAWVNKMFSGGLHFASLEELELMHNIYNKNYFHWEDAIAELESGRRLGCQISKTCGLYLAENNPDILMSYKGIENAAKVINREGEYVVQICPEAYWLEAAIAMNIPEHVPVRTR